MKNGKEKSMFVREYLWRDLMTVCGLFVILLTIVIGAFLVYKGSSTFLVYRHSFLEFLGSADWAPEDNMAGGGSNWLLHEAFCLYAERDIWKPYEKHHSTVKDACELAESLGIPNLVLWHTEDSNVAGRERLYKSEGKRYYSGNIYVPDDESLIAL